MTQDKGRKLVFTPENMASAELAFDVKLSPDAKQLLYHFKPVYKSGEFDTCAIWLGDVGRANSARQFTSGLYNDHAARFHPDGKRIIFLSDRHNAGGPAQIYSIALQGGEAHPLFGTDNKRGVSSFETSPDGRYVAFTSPDEPTPEDEQGEKEKDDAQVFGDKRSFDHLNLYSFATGDVRRLDASNDGHVESFLWEHDSKTLIFLTGKGSALEFTEEEIKVMRISLSIGATPEMIGNYPRFPTGIVLLSTGELVDIQSYQPSRISDSKSLFIHSNNDFDKTARLAYGKDNDAVRVVKLPETNHVAVEVARGLNTSIDILSRGPDDSFVSESLLEVVDGGIEMGSWDVRKSGEGGYVLAVIRSSSVHRDPSNVWTVTIVDGKSESDTVKISSHLKWMTEGPPIHIEPVNWSTEDGTKLDGIMVFPIGHEPGKTFQPYPTILMDHGGPYWRFTCDLSPSFMFASWQYPLAEQGYLVILPNYRGGQGHGSQFARAAHHGAGKLDWSDCESMVDMAIEQGYADPNRLGICGWSYGGYLTAWGVGQTKNRFKAGVMGAGISDWGMETATSELIEIFADIGGGAPWDTPDPKQRADILGSPIGHVSGVETAVLIMHGEQDERVPVSQGIAFFRGLRRRSKYPERHQLITYPREPHIFVENKHAQDVVKRVIEHFATWI